MKKTNKKILIDCSPITKGGGVQVLISTLNSIINQKTSYSYQFILTKSIYPILPSSLRNQKNIFWVKKENRFDKFKLIFKLYFLTLKTKPDIVYTLFGPPYFISFTYHIVGFAKPTLIYPPLRDNYKFFKKLKDFLSALIFKYANFYIVETKTVKKRLKDLLNLKDNTIFVLENSVNPELKKIYKYKKTHQKNDTSKIIFVPSSYYPHKNLEIILPITNYLLKKINNFKFILTINENDFKKYFKINSINKKLKNHIINIGPQELKSLSSYYSCSNIIFLPTLLECSTAVYPEAFYFKVPLITSNLDFAKELCGEAALYCEPKSYKDCAIKILQLIENKKLQEKLTFDGGKQLSKYLDNNKRLESLERIFEIILKSK